MHSHSHSHAWRPDTALVVVFDSGARRFFEAVRCHLQPMCSDNFMLECVHEGPQLGIHLPYFNALKDTYTTCTDHWPPDVPNDTRVAILAALLGYNVDYTLHYYHRLSRQSRRSFETHLWKEVTTVQSSKLHIMFPDTIPYAQPTACIRIPTRKRDRSENHEAQSR